MKNQMINRILILLLTLFFHAADLQAQKQLVLTKGSFLVLKGNVALVANNAAINNNGTIVPGNATFYFTGSSDTAVAYITGTSITTCTNLTIDKSNYGVAVKSPVHVTNVLKMIAGNLYPDSSLTLLSDANNTARLAAVPVSCSINGKVIVQRYIPAHRSWRLLTAPVTGSNTIYNAWQNGGVFTANTGTLITVPNPIAGDGMDAGINSNFSMKAFNQSTQSLVNITNTKTNTISPANTGSADNAGYFIFIRGDRTPATIGNPGMATLPLINTTLSCAGKLQTQSQVFTAAPVAGKYALIGNPYASPVDFNNITRSNVIKRFYVWDAELNIVGGYVALDDITNSGTFTKSVSASKQTNEIQSGQAFFVQTLSSGNASLTFNESSKSSTNNNLVFRPENSISSLAVNLYLLNDDSTVVTADGALAQFNEQFDAAVNWQDANKIPNVNEGIALLRESKALSIERRPLINSNDTLFLKITNSTARNYQLEIIPDNIKTQDLSAVLKDNFLNTTIPIHLDGTANRINFSVTADNASAAPDRFMILFNTASVLPLTFVHINAKQVNGNVQIQWNVADQVNIKRYDVERSGDGKNFRTVAMIKAADNISADCYSCLDTDPHAGYNYYRIKTISADGSIQYSDVVNIVINKRADKIRIYPTVITDKLINIQFSNVSSDAYIIDVMDISGQIVYSKETFLSGNHFIKTFILPASLSKGVYEIRVIKNAGHIFSKKIIIQ